MHSYISKEEFVWHYFDSPTFDLVIEPKLAELNALYESKKPQLEPTDTYTFIGMDVTEDSGNSRGILNCTVNNAHIQVRF